MNVRQPIVPFWKWKTRGLTFIWAAAYLAFIGAGTWTAVGARPLGIDVSNAQGSGINWASVKSSGGVYFAWAKATEGLTFNDADFTINAANAKAAGVIIGAYHFGRYDLHTGTSGADQEAAHFWSIANPYIKGGGTYLMPMLDMEAATTGYTKTTLSQWVNQWCSDIVAYARSNGITVKPVIYASRSFAGTWFDSTVTQWIPWIAEWPASPNPQTGGPSATIPWSSWTVWQYTDATNITGAGTVDGDVFNGTTNSLLSTLLVTSGNNATFVNSSVGNGFTTGQTFTATIVMNNTGSTVWTNTGANPYRLGSQNPSNNTTWGTNRVYLPSSPINIGQNATLTINAVAPMTAGTYTFSWRMLQEPTNWFGDTFTTTINVVLPGPGTNLGPYTLDTGYVNPSSYVGSWNTSAECNTTVHYSRLSDASCNQLNNEAKWFPGITPLQYSGRGWLDLDALFGANFAAATVYYHFRDSTDADLLKLSGWNQCSYHCVTNTVYSSTLTVPNGGTLGGVHIFTADSGTNSSCTTACGSAAVEAGVIRLFGARWNYMDDWTCLGGFASSSVSDTSNRSFNEPNLYLYPAVDTTHGNSITVLMGLNGKTPGRVTTGDCNNANSLDFKGNASAYGGSDNMDAYGFGWVFAPSGGSAQFVMGSDDGNRLWVNGSLRNDNNATRGLTRDQDNTGVVPLTTGWNRVLFKVHNFTGGFQGTVSLRNNTNVNLNASINSYDLGGGYYSHSVGYEQDAWYPQIALTSVYGVSGPINGTAFFGNNTTVTASGTSNGQGPVPYWRTMQYQWGYGLDDADSDYADVSGAPTSATWSHTTIGVTGHRQFHFFAVSQSGRTSFQNSGRTGGSVFQDTGNYARYYDVYVDNLAPESPDLIAAAASDTTTINLQWVIPLDQGVNIGPGDNESLGAAGNQDGQNWYRVGDVGVQLYRNGSVVASWGTATSFSDASLVANTPYTYTIEARDNNSGSRGPWHNSTGQQDTNVVWTLSVPPTAFSINASPANTAVGSNITWTAASGFGPGAVEYYRYAWDRSPMHTFTDSETQWPAGTISTVPDVTGTWYLHVKGYNGADIGNGTFDYAISVSPAEPLQISSINASSGLVTLSWNAVSGMVYRVQYTPDLSANGWSNLVPDVQATNSTATASDDTTGAAQRFYRVMQLP